MKVAVIGGGISGLVAAFDLQKKGIDVELYEKNGFLGGVIQTSTLNGAQVEQGADAFLARVPEGIDLCQELGLVGDDLVSPVSSKVLIKTKTGLNELIQPHILGVPTEVEGLPEHLKTAIQVDLERTEIDEPDTDADSVGFFVRRRVGDDIYESQVAPLVGAISASDPDLLSLEITTPQFALAGKASPSLVKGLKSLAPKTENPQPVFYAPRLGMGEIIKRLASKLDKVIELNACIDNLEDIKADAIILAVPAFVASQLLPSAQLLNEIEYVSVGMIQLAYDKSQLPEEFLNTAGILTQKETGLNISAISFFNQKWGHHPTTETEILRVSVGRYGRDEIVSWSDEEIYKAVYKELAEEFQISGPPADSRISRWYKSFPQYFPASNNQKSHTERINSAIAELAKHKIYLAGSMISGVGIPACIRSGRQAAVVASQIP